MTLVTSLKHFPCWACSIYQRISLDALPTELFPECTIIDYALSDPGRAPVALVFVVDTCLRGGDLSSLKRAVQQAISLLPGATVVGLVTFSSHVVVHELCANLRPRACCLPGTRLYDPAEFQRLLGVSAPASRSGAAPAVVTGGE